MRRHLRDLLQDQKRSDMLYQEHTSEHGTLIADFSRQRVTDETLKLLTDLANKVHVFKACFCDSGRRSLFMAVLTAKRLAVWT